jgi:molybdopterin synthase catalytic subunit
MEVRVHITKQAIRDADWLVTPSPAAGARLTFTGHIREWEEDRRLEGICYEVYHGMAEREMHRICTELAEAWPVLSVVIVHREGFVAVQDAAVLVSLTAHGRAAALGFMHNFLNVMKRDVPIWKAKLIFKAQTQV